MARSESSPPTPPPAATPWSTASSTCPSPGRQPGTLPSGPYPRRAHLATKGDLARDMILRVLASPLPIAWVTADSAYGQDSHLRRFLEDAELSHDVAVPRSQQVHGPRIGHLITQARPEA
ncbi:transposase [Streptomyces sp. NPDC008222]|uniref:transposase n=1 Tax=Streptomyces sp. NPDC008222 TaxID=3364820 RepID=UPI0036E8F1C8